MLDGAPIGIKANIAVQGLPWHAGMGAYAGRIADADAACVAKLREAGAVVLGVLNMHEAGLGATNDNLVFGRCHNPYRHDFTPGGSSGGSAAAVAAGLCAAALGTDTLGSVRIPASYCGVFGHKPHHGLISTQGVTPLSRTLDDVGINARSAEDCRAIFEVLAQHGGYEPPIPPPVQSPRLAVIGLTGRAAADGAIAEALSRAADAARTAGAHVETIDPDWDWSLMRRASLAVVELEAHAEHAPMLALRPEGFSPRLRAMLDWAARQSPAKAEQVALTVADSAEHILQTLSAFDAVLTPTTSSTAFSFDDPAPDNQGDYTMLANICGLSATAFPAGMSDDGLPLSVQVMCPADAAALDWAGRLAQPIPAPADFRK